MSVKAARGVCGGELGARLRVGGMRGGWPRSGVEHVVSFESKSIDDNACNDVSFCPAGCCWSCLNWAWT